jgi:phospholipid-transporting ATPase
MSRTDLKDKLIESKADVQPEIRKFHSSNQRIDPNEYKKSGFVSNKIKTAKYTVWSFFPLNLLEQVTKMANIYFIIFAILQVIPSISNSNGQPTILLPLIFVIVVSMIKDFVEDYKRWKSDAEENNNEVKILQNGEEASVKWSDLMVGNIVKVFKDNFFPSDIIFIKSSNSENVCYVETKNLDGETNLKHKCLSKLTIDFMATISSAQEMNCEIECETPSADLYSFKGTVASGNAKLPIHFDQFLLRGSVLKNTEYIIGIVTYTGHDTKIMKNIGKVSSKRSKMEQETYTEILYIFCVQILVAFVLSICNISWYDGNMLSPYLAISSSKNYLLVSLQAIGIWLLTLVY